MEFEKVTVLPNGDRAWLQLQLETRSGAGWVTVTHEQAPAQYVRVSITGEIAPKGVRFGTNRSVWGQVRDLLPYGRTRRLWARWHLNDMNAGCWHQGGKREIGEVCPFNGYRYGSAWLVEPLTVEGALDLLLCFGAADGVTVLGRDGLAVEILATESEARGKLLLLQPQSVDWAITNSGWSLDSVGETVAANIG